MEKVSETVLDPGLPPFSLLFPRPPKLERSAPPCVAPFSRCPSWSSDSVANCSACCLINPRPARDPTLQSARNRDSDERFRHLGLESRLPRAAQSSRPPIRPTRQCTPRPGRPGNAPSSHHPRPEHEIRTATLGPMNWIGRRHSTAARGWPILSVLVWNSIQSLSGPDRFGSKGVSVPCPISGMPFGLGSSSPPSAQSPDRDRKETRHSS